jgi:asparagine synthase (glutamine-hydrolysing)
MCGILGTNFNGQIVNESVVANSLSHRGPDSSKAYADGEVGLLISRLAIVNSNFDDQPSFGCDERYVAVFNGEIYNYKVLASELMKLGHNFPEDFSDAAILPHMLEEFGYDFVNKLDGMFAIAVWDHKLKEIIIYRDSVGIKPLYYHISGRNIKFSSEISSIQKMIKEILAIEKSSLASFASHNLVATPLTFYEGVFSLVPGTYLRFGKVKHELVRWHKFGTNRNKSDLGFNESLQQLEELLVASISDQTSHGKCSALLLSGGLDSSLIAAIAKKRLNSEIETYHLAYENDITSKGLETAVARDVAKQLGYKFNEFKISSSEYFNQLDQVLNTFSQPFGGVTSTYFISKFIAEKHKVCLTGDGADELFASYRNIQKAARIYYGQDSIENEKNITSTSDLSDFFKMPMVFNMTRSNNELIYPLQEEVSALEKKLDVFNFTLLESQLHLLPDQVLLFSDHLGMAHGLEIRPPFLSKSIIEFSREIPLEYLIDANGTTKLILKKLALGYFDEKFVLRKKEGFMLPLNEWMKTLGGEKWSQRKLDEYLDSRNKLLDRAKLQSFFSNFYSGSHDDFFRVYRLSTLMHYLKNYE